MEAQQTEPPNEEVTLPADIWQAGLRILKEPDVFAKVRLSHAFNQAYKDGLLPLPPLPVPQEKVDAEVPAVPARPSPPPQLSRKAKPIESTIHGIAHAESYAIDLMWDLIVRFASDPALGEEEFYSDFVEIADQEARHFMSWVDRLEDFGIAYGQLPGTQTLWDAATVTSDDVMARLALVNLLHEARGLDTFAASHKRLERSGDDKSASTLRHNYLEEIHHVRTGRKWFEHVHRVRGLTAPVTEVFQGIIRERYRGRIVGPFNEAARLEAGMGPDWYMPLTEPPRDPSVAPESADTSKSSSSSGCCDASDN